MKYTKRQIKRAGRARVTYRTLGSLTVENFKNVLKQNLIKNCPVTIKDVEIAEDIFGPDISTLKGRSTRKKPPVIVNDQMEVPRELVYNWDNLTLCIDNMYVLGQIFLTAINTTIKYRSATHLQNHMARELYAGLNRILRNYNNAKYRVGHIHCNQEFKTILEKVCDDMDI